MDEKEYKTELKKKLVEEAKELLAAPDEKLVNELADVLELIKSIASSQQINFKDIEKYQIEKRKKRGGFDKRRFLIWSTGKSSNKS